MLFWTVNFTRCSRSQVRVIALWSVLTARTKYVEWRDIFKNRYHNLVDTDCGTMAAPNSLNILLTTLNAIIYFSFTHAQTFTSGSSDLVLFLPAELRTMSDFPLCSISSLGSSPLERFSKQNLTKEPLSFAAGFVSTTCQYLMHFARLMATKLGGIPTGRIDPSIHEFIFSMPFSLSYCKGSNSKRSPTMFSKSTSISSLWYRE